MTTEVVGADGKVAAIKCTKVDENMAPIAGSEFELQADLVLLAMGFIHPVHGGLVDDGAGKRRARKCSRRCGDL